MKPNNSTFQNLILAFVASLTLGLAPFYPEPHIIGKLKWIAGGGQDMQMMDYADLVMHGMPWVFLLYFSIQVLKSKIFNQSKMSKMDIVELLKSDNGTVVDVREISEYNAGHIPGALHVPLSRIASRMKELRSLEGPIILYCRSGFRSGRAVQFLESQGIGNAYNGGGLNEMRRYLSVA